MLDAKLTRHGAVETPQEGALYARFLQEHRKCPHTLLHCLAEAKMTNGPKSTFAVFFGNRGFRRGC
jgi:hypothetical protein